MQLFNTNERYGLIAILFHWVMAILIVGLLSIGLYMTRIPVSLTKLKLFGWHKEYGMLILLLVTLRIGWRMGNVNPSLSELPVFERKAARSVHWIFYVLMIVLPMTGWLITSAAGLKISFFGLFLIPNLISPNETSRIFFQDIHEWLSYGLIALICGHVAAALKHHFINKDNILRRML